MRYYSDKLGGKLFDTEEALFKAEREAADKEKEAAAAKLKIATKRNKLVEAVNKCQSVVNVAYEEYTKADKALSAARMALNKFDFEHNCKNSKKAISNADSIFDVISDILSL